MLRWFAAVLCLVVALGQPARAEEVIRNFISDVTVGSDGTLTVRETLTFNVEGYNIKHGIKRDFPLSYMDKHGQQVKVGFEVVSVERNGKSEPYSSTYISNGIQLKIGSADVYLTDGEQTWKIIYRTTRQVGFFDSYDELYWNVTGNGWTFPIEHAQAIVRLPEGASTGEYALYTGAQGVAGKDARVVSAGGNRFVAETTRRLEPGEGFTIAVNWQKGIVAPPSEAQKRWWWIQDNLGYFLLGLTVILVGLYYLWAWNKVGRDPPGGQIVPLFHPPKGLGPAGVRYIWKQGFDNEAFAAAVVGLAVKKRVVIEDDDGDYAISKGGQGQEPLTRTEQELLKALPAGTLKLKRGSHLAVNSARSAIKTALDDEFDGTMFLRNLKWFVLGAVLSGIGLIVSGFMMPSGEGAVVAFTAIFSTIWWGVVLTVGWAMAQGVRSGSVWMRIKSLFTLIFLVPFVFGGIAVPAATIFGTGASWPMMFFLAGAVGLGLFNLLFYWLLKAPTVKGRAMLDQIEGFRMYMTTAEEDRLNVLNPPEKTPELFERYLPYAMALDCENEWNAKFAAVLAAAAAAGAATATSPSWYHGNNWSSGGFSRDLGSSLASSISSASVAPGSSSGSRGGGFSGGGGGGGGGSGW
ncbi:MAG: DUF2207 domain-containing protein [Rhizobiales bacterium]|nr:DUF2207 domain-containing protein [Hyphomicrobiales bacterium]